MGLGEIFSLASAVFWAIAVIMFTRIGTRLPPFELNLAKNIIGCFLLSLTALVLEWGQWFEMPITDWLILIFSGVIGIAIADTLYMKALNTIGAGNTGIVAALYSPFVIVISIIYLDEKLSLIQLVGLSLVMFGIVLISRDKNRNVQHQKSFWIGVLLGATSVFLTALGVVIVKPILEQQPFFWSSSLRLFAGVLGMLIFIGLKGQWKTTLERYQQTRSWKSIIIASIFGAYLAMALWLAGYKYTEASIAAILNETTSFFIVLLAWFFLKEPLSKNKISGLGFAIAGVLMVVLDH